MQAGDKVERLADKVTGIAVSFDPQSSVWRVVFDDVPNMVMTGYESDLRILASHSDKPGMSLADSQGHAQTLKYARQAGELQGLLGFVGDTLKDLCGRPSLEADGYLDATLSLMLSMIKQSLANVAEL